MPAAQPTSPVESMEAEDINIDYDTGRMVPGDYRGRDMNRAHFNPSFFPRNEQLFKRWVDTRYFKTKQFVICINFQIF